MSRLESIKENMASCTDLYVDNSEFLDDMKWLIQRLERYELVLRDISSNYDCDSDAHKYGTSCRKCEAKEALKEDTHE